MRGNRNLRNWAGWACALAALQAAASAQTILYYTQFEQAEGYDPAFTLAGQQGWLVSGTGGNGLIENFIEGYGQQAYIGFHPPTAVEDFTSVWQPVGFDPVPTGENIVRFSVLLDFEPSTVGGQDDFRWSIYNAEAVRLFSLDFETSTSRISYLLDDNVFQDTGWTFGFDGVYDLTIWMDFARNVWTAVLNGIPIVLRQPITTTGAQLTFGDADAVWAIRDPNVPGDNFMVFDEYIVVAGEFDQIPEIGPTLEPVGLGPDGSFQFYIHGQEGVEYSVQVSSDLKTWFSLGNFVAPEGGTFLFEDIFAHGYPIGFYRLGPPL